MTEQQQISPELFKALSEQLRTQIKDELVEELKGDKVRAQEALDKRREEEKLARDAYVKRMKESAEPWVDIIGQTDTDQGVRTELDWNEAFVDYLRQNGIKGIDDDQVVQKWLALMLRDIADEIEGPLVKEGRSASEFA